jgi:glycosyltransferase involved in cell wall biosynthesis
MKIAVYHNLMSGGAKRALYETTRRIAQDHRVDVFTLSSAEHAFCDLRPVVANYRVFGFESFPLVPSPFGALNHGVRAADILRLRPVQRLIAAEIDAGGYDVALVYASDRFTNGPMLLQYLKTPSVCYCNDPLRAQYDPTIMRPYSQLAGARNVLDRVNVLRPLYHGLQRHEDRRSLRAAGMLLVNSYFSRETIYRIYAVQPHVCYLGVDTDVFRPTKAARGNYVVSVGTINPIKGHDFVIRSLALVPAMIRPRLVIVGNFSVPEEEGYLLDLARAGTVQVESRVMVDTTDLVDLYSRAKMTLYAPVLEPFGFVALESMACGTPVVSVAEGGVRETIRHGETGLLTDRDPSQFAQSVTRLLDNPTYAQQLGDRGPEYVQQHWSWDQTMTSLRRYLDRFCSQKKLAAA